MGDLEWAKGRDVFLNLDYLMKTHFYCGVSRLYRTGRVQVRSEGVTNVVRRQGEVEEKQVKNVENQSHIRAWLRRVTMDPSRKYVELLDRILDLDKKVEDS